MKTFIVSGLAIAALAVAGAANAADLPVYKAPPPAAPVAYSWSGAYFGGNLGGGFGDKWWNTTDTTICALLDTCLVGITVIPGQTIGTTSVDGFLGGLQAGFNVQSGPFVFGVEGDVDWTDMKGRFDCIVVLTCSSKIDWIASVVGRAGVAVMDRLLVYAGGGGTWAREQDRIDFAGASISTLVSVTPFGFSARDDKWGWTFLTGAEYAFARNWSVKLQYNYYNFGSHNAGLSQDASACVTVGILTPVCVAGLHTNVDTQLRTHAIRAGLNYKFNWGS
jgi:outer membrane immunogenic protein